MYFEVCRKICFRADVTAEIVNVSDVDAISPRAVIIIETVVRVTRKELVFVIVV